jgi:hypothetical protein
MVSLLGHPPRSWIAYRFQGQFQPVSIPCQLNISNFTVTILLYRRSPINELKALAVETQRLRNNETIKKNDQRDFVESNPNRTAIIANVGAWMHSMKEYQEGFDSMVSWIDSFHPSKILAFYRETIPSHPGCKPHGEKGQESSYNWIHPVQEEPHVNYESFYTIRDKVLNNTEYLYHNLFEAYNEYSRKAIQERSDDKVRIHWLNVFNSSVLRRDGHIGFGDCLHYYLPGPTDWWAHFFYSTICDLADEANLRNVI